MEYLNKVGEWAAWLWSFWQVKFLLGHIALNLVVAIAASIRTGDFVLARTGEFLYKKVLPFLFVYAIFAIFGDATGFGAIQATAFAALEAMLAGDLLDNLYKLGVPIPPGLTKNPLGLESPYQMQE